MKSFKRLIAEVAEPKSEDELNFKAKHEIEMIDHPESEEDQHTAEKKSPKRLADYAKGEDMAVYKARAKGADESVNESKMEDSEVLSAAKALAKNGKDAKTKSFGQGLVDYYDENGSFTPAQVGGLQNIMKNASFQLAKESVELSENFKPGSVSLDDGSKVVVSKQNADLLNQMFDELNPKNKKEMMAVAMKDKRGFDDVLSFAREAL